MPDLHPKPALNIESVSLNQGTFCDPHPNQGEAYSLTPSKGKSKPANKTKKNINHQASDLPETALMDLAGRGK